MTVYEMAARLPGLQVLRDRSRALAMLDAIVSAGHSSRRYHFKRGWRPGTDLATMNDEQGDDYSILFRGDAAFVRGFSHESPMSPSANDDEVWPGLVDDVPDAFADVLQEPAFQYEDVFSATYCLWHTGDAWRAGDIEFPEEGDDDVDGSQRLAIVADAGPGAYLAFAADFYGTTVDPAAAAEIWALTPLSESLVRRLNPAADPEAVNRQAATIGYPLG
ncbi:hypothetical protein [Dactylosporangium sp. NPDC049140]|uniref:hypothetical protein n=1 Tax=Dactylosporangium sp. NPDC049140 TaxID=3155647 RepID=UPI0033BFB946